MIPACSLRGELDGKATCSSKIVRTLARGFDPNKVCVNNDGSPCAFANKVATDEEIEARVKRRTKAQDMAAIMPEAIKAIAFDSTPQDAPPKDGPGTELKAIFAENSIETDMFCGCDAKIAQMNRWGVRDCRQNRVQIVQWFIDETRTEKGTWGSIAFDFLGALVDLAIERAEQKVSAHVREFEAHALKPLSVHRFDEANLLPGTPGPRFNASIIRYQGRELMAWRLGTKGASILLTELPGMMPGRTWCLDLKHRLATYGKEDPRLAIINGRLFVGFSGVSGAAVNWMYALLGENADGFFVENVWYPDYAQREPREKNWGLFGVADMMFAVYSLQPLVFLELDGSNVMKVHEQAWESPWQAGLMRGGASPCRVGDEWYLFFHGVDPRDRRYTVGCLVLDRNFRPVRCTRWPIVVPSDADRPASEGNSAWYVCGAIRDGDDWLISGGVHNSRIEIHRYKASDVEAALEVIP